MIDVEEYLSNYYKGTKNRSLKAMKYFMKEFNNFEKKMNFIHIAGTNGKGSCTEMLINVLIKQGYKVGKFLSPHLIKYNERISIAGKDISDKEMSELIEELQPIINKYNEKEKDKVTLFELETIMALLYFYRNNVDLVVLETGSGGITDCTNIITKPIVSIITSIGYDHMRILGDTLQKIASHKAGIIKKDSNTVIFDQEKEVNQIFIDECNKKQNKLHVIHDKDIKKYYFDDDYQYFDYKNIKDICVNLKGKAQIRNAAICIETLEILKQQGFKIENKNIKEGLRTVIHRGRIEQLNTDPNIIFDGAHNEPAIKNFLEMINMYYNDKKRVYIISILARKDYNAMLKLLAEDKNATFIVTSGNNTYKYATKDELYDCMKQYTDENKICKKNLENAIKEAEKGKDIINFVIGSLYTYSKVNEIIEKEKSKK